MRSIQLTLDEDLANEINLVASQLKITRSALVRQALSQACLQLREKEQERRHQKGYARLPIDSDEFTDWENEQVWVG